MSQIQCNTSKGEALLALIAQGLQAHSNHSTALTLGDRTKYIGMSDIGRALECPRAALCNKLYPLHQANLQKLLTLQRGHWFEHGIGQALSAQGLRILPQLELSFVHKCCQIKVHFDFVLAWDKPHPAIRILELKSTKHLPETLYTSYECQVYGQVGLLAKLWNQPVFSLRDQSGTLLHENLTMPELCKAYFGLSLPNNVDEVDLEAWVLCLSMSEAKAFGAYFPNNSMLDLCLNTAQTLWENKIAVLNGALDINTVEHAYGFHALCSYCDWNADCPKFHTAEYQPEWQTDLEQLANLKTERCNLDAEIETLEQNIKNAYALSRTKDWIQANSYRFRVIQQSGRRTLNKDLLRCEIVAILGDEQAVDKLLAGCEVGGKPYARLNIGKVN